VLAFVGRRLALTIVTLAIVSIIVFAASQVLPGDVGRVILGPYAPRSQIAALDHRLGIDRPLVSRYVSWIAGFVRGDWGTSYTLQVPVRTLVLSRLWHSLLLGWFTFVLIVPFSVFMGVMAALRGGRCLDRLVSVVGMSLIALPEFVAGVILLVIFAVEVTVFPVSSSVPGLSPVDWFRQFLLPAVPLMFVEFGYISRMARAGTLEALASNYARTAVLKGLPQRVIVRRHILRNSLLPTITVVAVQVGYLIGGLAVTETVFNYPGIGKLVVDSATGHDLPTLESCVLAIAIIYMVVNLVADLCYALMDPRIRGAGA
jgi:peptide/nickel transport system permease protein